MAANKGLKALTLVLGLIAWGKSQEVNKLSPSESQAGYDLLFNGSDLSNWHAYKLASVTDAWKVRTNTPLGPRIENGDGNKLPILTNKKFMNFDFKADVLTTNLGNSGIFTRYEENATSHEDARSGPEFQICGPGNDDCDKPIFQFGACYYMFAVNESIRTTWYNPPGSWNQIRIIGYDSNYVHYGNGKKLLEYKIGTQPFLDAYNDSKYANDGNNGRYYHIHPGGILLQHHGENGMAFRNLKAKELTTHPFRREFLDGKWPDELSQDFAFGVTTSAHSFAKAPGSNISVRYTTSGTALVDVPAAHSHFKVLRIDGRVIPFQKISENVYSINRHGGASDLVIVRLRMGEELLNRIVSLQ